MRQNNVMKGNIIKGIRSGGEYFEYETIRVSCTRQQDSILFFIFNIERATKNGTNPRTSYTSDDTREYRGIKARTHTHRDHRRGESSSLHALTLWSRAVATGGRVRRLRTLFFSDMKKNSTVVVAKVTGLKKWRLTQFRLHHLCGGWKGGAQKCWYALIHFGPAP